MQYPNYYATLGLSKDATPDEIKKAYRKLARKYHPDVSKEADAAQRMSAINEANEVLSDPAKRSVYDQVGHQAWAQGARSPDDVRPPPGWEQAFTQRPAGRQGHAAFHDAEPEHSEFFETLFGQAARARARDQTNTAWRGDDQHAELEISLAEAYRGGQRALQLEQWQIDARGHPLRQRRTLEVTLPKGVAEGQVIRLAGQGQPGGQGGAAGDLLLRIHIQAEPGIRLEGRQVFRRLAVTPWEAALGAEIRLPTPDGQLAVTIPAGSIAGRKLRLRGKGIPGREPGDLILELDIAMPSAVTAEQKAAWQALANAYPGFNPRPA